MHIGFCGIGRMGGAMAARLLDCGHTLTVWNRTPEKAEPLVARGARPAGTPAEVAQAADVVLSILMDDAAVDEVYGGRDGLLSGGVTGKTFVEMSTIRPETARRIAALAQERGAAVIDCPVSGTVGPARDGKLIGLAGGDPAAFARVRDVLAQLCRRVDNVGPSGAGATAKLAVNLPLVVYWGALGEALALCRDAGIDPKLLLDIMKDSSGGTNALPGRTPKILAALAGEKAEVAFTIDGMCKDVASMIAVGDAQGAALPITGAALQHYRDAAKSGLGDHDGSAVTAFVGQRR
jgi:3-hydroxyisobutyrate dehydrogenase